MKTTNKNIFRTKMLKKWFTLVELIVVITILAILATIWFVSFQWFLKDARDWNRVASIKSIWEWLELNAIKIWKYPTPDKQENETELLTWALLIEWQKYEYSYLWEIWETVMRNIWLAKESKDPMTWNKYTYAITKDGKEYQLASILEWNIAKGTMILNKVNASSYKAKVDWNHKAEIIYDTWTKKYLTIVLSMIYDKNWGNILNNTWAILIVDKQGNTPYWNNTSAKTAQKIIKEIKWEEEAEIITQEIPEEVINWTQSVENWLNTLSNSWVILKSIWAIESNSWWVITPNIPLLEQIVTWNITTQSTISQNNNCEFNWNTVEHWTNVTAYLTENVPHWSICTQEQRTCTNGTLSWSYTYSSCEVSWATWTFTLSSASVVMWASVTITNNCSVSPTSYASSNTSVATTSWDTITTIAVWTTDITPVWWACWDNGLKTLTVTAPPTREVYWDEDADAIAACNEYVHQTIWSNAWWYQNWIWVPARNFTTDWVWTALTDNYYKRNVSYNGTNYICKWFVVAKYEMSYNETTPSDSWNASRWTRAYSSSKIPVSMPDRLSVANLTQPQAISQCWGLGSNYHLITNNEWMAIARNIEQQASNWSWGAVWNWYIDNWLDNITPPNWNGVVWCYDDDGIYTDPTWAWSCQNERQLSLSNWQKIWDLAWNVWEHVNKANTIDGTNFDSNSVALSNACWGNNWYSWNNNESITPAAAWWSCNYQSSYTQAKYGPAWATYTSDEWMWRIYSYNVANNIFLRGGHAYGGASSGVFTLHLYLAASAQGVSVGFRCSL